MGLIIKGAPKSAGSFKIKVPTPTYSGVGVAGDSAAINPYTLEGPVIPGPAAFMAWAGTGTLHILINPITSKIETSELTDSIWLSTSDAGTLHTLINPITSKIETSELADSIWLAWNGT